MARILILDDDEARHLVYASRYKDHEVVHVRGFFEAQKALEGPKFDLIHFDHDLADFTDNADGYTTMYGSRVEFTGADVARVVRALPPERRPDQAIIHSWNPDGVKNIASILKGYVRNIVIERYTAKFG